MHFETVPSDVSNHYQQQQNTEKVFPDKGLPCAEPSNVERCTVCSSRSFNSKTRKDKQNKVFHRYVPLVQSNTKVTSNKNFTCNYKSDKNRGELSYYYQAFYQQQQNTEKVKIYVGNVNRSIPTMKQKTGYVVQLAVSGFTNPKYVYMT